MEKFLENKHKLVYFLVTASAAPIVVVVQFAYGKSLPALVIAAAVSGILAGLGAAGSALRALQFEIASYRAHIQHRYARKTWETLTEAEQKAWNQIIRRATGCTTAAFALIWLEFALFAIVGISLLVVKPATSKRISVEISLLARWRWNVHHFGEDMVSGRIENNGFIVEARHHATGAKVIMRGPTSGVLDDSQVVDENLVRRLASSFAHFLRENLNPDVAATASI